MPEWQVSEWLNTPQPISLASLRGRVVLLHTFQMLCPGCVMHSLPQAQRVHQAFPASEVAVIGLHTVFEHHAVMTPDALRAFVHEYRLSFPIGIDAAGGPSGVPRTMADYGLRGTPSHLVFDHEGRVAMHHFGRVDDLELGGLIGRLIGQAAAARVSSPGHGVTDGCSAEGCALPAGRRA